MALAMGRVFTQHGERKRRMKARMKFLVEKLGIDEFRRLVEEERPKLEYDPRWTAHLDHLDATDESPLKPPSSLNGRAHPAGVDRWALTNLIRQRDEGYVSVQVTLPLGDITSDQLRGLADAASKYVKDTVRFTVPQNVLLRWVSEGDLIDLYGDDKPVILGLRPLLPPTIIFDAAKTTADNKALNAELQMGDLLIHWTCEYAPGQSEVFLTTAIALFANVDIGISPGKQTISIEFGDMDLSFDMVGEPLFIISEVFVETLMPLVIESLIPPLLGALLGDIPIPTFQGYTLNVQSFQAIGNLNDYAGMFGELVSAP